MNRRDAILVTGASGFVGRHVLGALARAERPVLAVPGPTRAVDAPGPSIRILPRRSLGPDTDWGDALADVECVVHLAALAHGRDRGDAATVARVNVEGTLALAEAARAAEVRRFLFLSSIGVHGSSTRAGGASAGIIDEAAPIAPDTVYARSKWAAEEGLRAILRESATELVVLRPPLVYGPDAPGNPARLVRLLRSGLPLPLASVRNRRSFVSIENLCAALLRCIDDGRAGGRVFVIADGEVVSTPELLRAMALRLGVSSRLVSCPVALLRVLAGAAGRGEDLKRMISDLEVDASRIRRVLDFEPPLTFDEGLDRWLLGTSAK